MDLDLMEPGRELDALVAEKVMGIKTHRTSGTCFVDDSGKRLPHFSRNITDAWAVLARFAGQNRGIAAEYLIGSESSVWYVVIARGPDAAELCGSSDGEAETLPHAICLAALKASEPTSQPISH